MINIINDFYNKHVKNQESRILDALYESKKNQSSGRILMPVFCLIVSIVLTLTLPSTILIYYTYSSIYSDMAYLSAFICIIIYGAFGIKISLKMRKSKFKPPSNPDVRQEIINLIPLRIGEPIIMNYGLYDLCVFITYVANALLIMIPIYSALPLVLFVTLPLIPIAWRVEQLILELLCNSKSFICDKFLLIKGNAFRKDKKISWSEISHLELKEKTKHHLDELLPTMYYSIKVQEKGIIRRYSIKLGEIPKIIADIFNDLLHYLLERMGNLA